MPRNPRKANFDSQIPSLGCFMALSRQGYRLGRAGCWVQRAGAGSKQRLPPHTAGSHPRHLPHLFTTSLRCNTPEFEPKPLPPAFHCLHLLKPCLAPQPAPAVPAQCVPTRRGAASAAGSLSLPAYTRASIPFQIPLSTLHQPPCKHPGAAAPFPTLVGAAGAGGEGEQGGQAQAAARHAARRRWRRPFPAEGCAAKGQEEEEWDGDILGAGSPARPEAPPPPPPVRELGTAPPRLPWPAGIDPNVAPWPRAPTAGGPGSPDPQPLREPCPSLPSLPSLPQQPLPAGRGV